MRIYNTLTHVPDCPPEDDDNKCSDIEGLEIFNKLLSL